MIFHIHKRFSNLRTVKNPPGAVLPWDLERVGNDEIPATKRRKPSMFETMLPERHVASRYLVKGREFKTHRGGNARRYDRKILDVVRYIAIFGYPSIFPSWGFLEYDWNRRAEVFLENRTVRPPGFLPCAEELRLPAGGRGNFLYTTVTEYCNLGAIEAQIASGELQKSDQICAFIDVYKKEGTMESVLGAAFYKVDKRYLKKGEYGRAYGGFLSLGSLPKNVRGACLSGGPFYEVDIKNSSFSILYADLLSIWGLKTLRMRPHA